MVTEFQNVEFICFCTCSGLWDKNSDKLEINIRLGVNTLCGVNSIVTQTFARVSRGGPPTSIRSKANVRRRLTHIEYSVSMYHVVPCYHVTMYHVVIDLTVFPKRYKKGINDVKESWWNTILHFFSYEVTFSKKALLIYPNPISQAKVTFQLADYIARGVTESGPG